MHACLRKASPTERAGVSGGKVSVRTVTRTLGLVGGAIPQSPHDGGDVPHPPRPAQQPPVTGAGRAPSDQRTEFLILFNFHSFKIHRPHVLLASALDSTGPGKLWRNPILY